MFDQKQEILIIVVAGAVLFSTLVISIFIFVVIYQKKNYRHQLEKAKLKEAFNKEILSSRLEMQEQTLLSISQEIHDNIGQILSLVRLNVSTININNPEVALEKISSSKELLDQAIQDLRDLSKQLNRDYLTQKPLSELLQFQLNQIKKIGAFNTAFNMCGEEKPMDQDKKLIVFRIIQETLNNAIKHSFAEKISVILSYFPGRVLLNIKDNGKGFDSEKMKSDNTGVGAFTLASRAKLIGGSYTISSQPGEGTEAVLEIPLTALIKKT